MKDGATKQPSLGKESQVLGRNSNTMPEMPKIKLFPKSLVNVIKIVCPGACFPELSYFRTYSVLSLSLSDGLVH
jgi:hypothetical protein